VCVNARSDLEKDGGVHRSDRPFSKDWQDNAFPWSVGTSARCLQREVFQIHARFPVHTLLTAGLRNLAAAL